MELGTTVYSNDMFTTLPMKGSELLIQYPRSYAGIGSKQHDLEAIFFTKPESSSSEVAESSVSSQLIVALSN
jgi:hypothetical protein